MDMDMDMDMYMQQNNTTTSHTHTHPHTPIHTHTSTHKHTHTPTHIPQPYIHTSTVSHTHTRMHARTHACTHARIRGQNNELNIMEHVDVYKHYFKSARPSVRTHSYLDVSTACDFCLAVWFHQNCAVERDILVHNNSTTCCDPCIMYTDSLKLDHSIHSHSTNNTVILASKQKPMSYNKFYIKSSCIAERNINNLMISITFL